MARVPRRKQVPKASRVAPLLPAPSRLAWAPSDSPTRKRVTPAQLASAAYHWLTWALATCLVFSQFFSIFWTTVQSTEHVVYGQSPLLGNFAIPGTNDEPYTDRSIVCVKQGRTYVPLTVTEALKLGNARVADTSGAAVGGYRLVNRTGVVISSDAARAYANTCAHIAITLDTILRTCALLGYNVTQHGLDIVGDVHSTTTVHLPQALPVVVMPFWDNGMDARSAIPGVDGSACMFRLMGKYVAPHFSSLLLEAVNRTVREARTAAWLREPDGVWRNGWYETRSGTKWYSDVLSSDPHSGYDILRQRFNMTTGTEVDCSDMAKCTNMLSLGSDAKFRATMTQRSMASIAIANGERFGLFLYEGVHLYTVTSEYDWQTLLSNAVIGRVLLVWLYAKYALARAYKLGLSEWHNAGIGCLANAPALKVLPLALLPRLRSVLLALWSVGCEFEGPQFHLSRAWFVMYPSIMEFMFFYYSILNAIAKLSGRRMTDALFGVSTAALCALHWYRHDLMRMRWLGVDGRVTSLITQDEMASLGMFALLSPRTALRANGNVASIFYTKVALLALSLVPLVLSRRRRPVPASSTATDSIKALSGAECTLAVRLDNSGGLGQRARQSRDASPPVELNSYELVRLGYVVFGDLYVVSLEDWELLTLVSPLRAYTHMWNHRVAVFRLERTRTDAVVLSESPVFCRVDDAKLQQIRWWETSARDLS